jgi:hypothetical protein
MNEHHFLTMMRLPLLSLLLFLATAQCHLWGRPNLIPLKRSSLVPKRRVKDEAVMRLLQQVGRGGSTTGTCSLPMVLEKHLNPQPCTGNSLKAETPSIPNKKNEKKSESKESSVAAAETSSSSASSSKYKDSFPSSWLSKLKAIEVAEAAWLLAIAIIITASASEGSHLIDRMFLLFLILGVVYVVRSELVKSLLSDIATFCTTTFIDSE